MKSITLMGMSGVGKSTMARRLNEWGWSSYSCDLAICRSLLNSDGRDDTAMLSVFLGQLGNPNQGGFSLKKFKERQRLYYDEELQSLRRIEDIIAQARRGGFDRFVHDATGSFCEIEDDGVIDLVGQNSLIVYIKTSEEGEREILQRAQDNPKPLFFPPAQFDVWLRKFLDERGFEDVRQIEPEDFTRWVFPLLFQTRLPKYQKIADRYGITIPFDAFQKVESEDDFMELIGRHG